MKKAPTVDRLLEIDSNCARESVAVFGQLGESASQCADQTLAIFAAAAEWLNSSDRFRSEEEELTAIAADLKASVEVLWEAARAPATPGEDPRISQARKIQSVMLEGMAFKTLLQIIGRAYRWAITDFRRLRATAAAGYMRIEVESIALMIVMRDNRQLARRWLNPREDMMAFFRETQSKTISPLRTFCGFKVACSQRCAMRCRG